MEHYLWCELYRPKTVSETILPPRLKETFQKFVDNRNVPNLILTGGPGVGKTTVAKAILEQLDCNYMVINSSMNGNIDTLRNDILQFASTVSFKGGRKYVILEEGDHLTATTQAAMRNFIEEYSANCGFIFTCNYKNKIIEPLHSRCAVIEFKFLKDEKIDLVKQIYKRLTNILTEQNIQYDKNAVLEFIKKFFPDFRRMINELQRYSQSGTVDSGILVTVDEKTIQPLIQMMKDKDFTSIRKWVTENSDINDDEIYKKLYDVSSNYFTTSFIPQLVLILAKYSYQSSFCVNREINLSACLIEIMIDGEFK